MAGHSPDKNMGTGAQHGGSAVVHPLELCYRLFVNVLGYGPDPCPKGMLHRHRTTLPMSKSLFDYLTQARRFERLACMLSDEEVKRLLQSQAETCYRLALKAAPRQRMSLPHPDEPD